MPTFDPTTPVLIRSSGEITEYQPSGKTFSLKELQEAVGGYIEVVTLPPKSSGKRKIKRIMVMNEEGLLHRLPPNVVASAVFGPDLAVPIVGDVVICPSRLLR